MVSWKQDGSVYAFRSLRRLYYTHGLCLFASAGFIDEFILKLCGEVMIRTSRLRLSRVEMLGFVP